MPDTYYEFVLGYCSFVVLLFGLMGVLLKRILRLETEVENIQKSLDSK